MSENAETYQRLWQEFRETTSLDEIIERLEQLNDLVQTDTLSIVEAYDLRVSAFRALQELTVDDFGRGEQLIFDLVVPYCLVEPTDVPQKVHYTISRYRECLVDWLNQYPETERTVLRNKVFDILHSELAANPKPVCWTISRIGFRRPDLVEALWDVAEKNADGVGDIALSTLTSLGVPQEERPKLLSALHQRAAKRHTSTLTGALSRLADPSSLEVIRKHWLQPDYAGIRYRLLTLTVLAEIADAADANPNIQDRIWQTISDWVEANPDTPPHAFLGGNIAPHCNSVHVVPTILRWLTKESESNSERTGTILYRRLQACVRPRQLTGWDNADASAAISQLREDACQDTGHEGSWMTEEMRLKEAAWDVLLRLEYHDALTWFEGGVVAETNPFVQKGISELLACFRIDPLPPTVLQWVTDRYDEQQDGSLGSWAPRMAAIEVAWSAASWEAFQALLNFGFTWEGEALQQSVDALADVAIVLAQADTMSVADALMSKAIGGSEEHQRRAAVGALHAMAAADLLPPHYAPRITQLVADEARDSHERSMLVATLGRLSAEELPQDVLHQLRSWASGRTDWLGWRSLEALARCGYLVKDSELLRERLNLQRKGEAWDAILDTGGAGWAPFIVGLLYLQEPSMFSPAIVSLLETQNWHSVIQVVRLLDVAHAKSSSPPLAEQIQEALIKRTRERQTRTSAEMEMFDVLARLMPDSLAQEPWERVWSDWLPESRAALADALGEATYTEPQAEKRAQSLLLSLMRDGRYAVRRSAYRSLARLSSESLAATCITWTGEEAGVELHQRAAEAIGWLSSGREQGVFRELYECLTTDPEPVVREAADRAWRERRERLWAEEYLSYVCAVEGQTNEEMLSAWRYGQALAQLGDDKCAEVLRTHLATPSLPPHVRYWIQRITKDINDRWRKVTKEWPEPWLAWEGTIERGEGRLVLSDGSVIAIHYSLWEKPAATPSQKHSWGGAAWSVGLRDLQAIFDDDKISLQTGDGREAMVLVTGVTDGVATFKGRGSYPRIGQR